jgi:hypothetical protein
MLLKPMPEENLVGLPVVVRAWNLGLGDSVDSGEFLDRLFVFQVVRG